jgi:transcriptional regulator with XRE-family HTH domain
MERSGESEAMGDLPPGIHLQDCDLLIYRIRMGLTLRQLSEKAEMSVATIHRIETGKVGVTARSKESLCRAYELTYEQLEILIRNTRRNGCP